ncbi:hypothetical protein SAMN05216480_12342 [Pustulibacterium marinum]|uniref:Uncharacterized protein n=1 Tax=Pustulibacterium marinum TaxID=1224947 RepID=A0A1I7IWM0_9FLAO|nr:hypothetical protein SAMN05216480_12342 [Pustulibacterium marinum]
MQSELDSIGIYTAIVPFSATCFQWIINGELHGQFNKRETANIRLENLYNEKILKQ